jgi:hypothetical protein
MRVVDRQRRQGREHAIHWAKGKHIDKAMPRGALTKEQLNEKRREYAKANAAEINRKQRERRRANSAEVNRKQKERRLANLDEVRRKDRERYHSRRDAEKTAHISKGPQHERVSASSAPSAAESVRNWLKSRGKQENTPADESLSRWLADREQEIKGGPDAGPPRARSGDQSASRERGTGGKQTKTTRKNDLSL